MKLADLINIKALMFKDNTLAIFKNYTALGEKQSGCQLNVLYIDRGRKYMGEFDDDLKENSITYEVTASYSLE